MNHKISSVIKSVTLVLFCITTAILAMEPALLDQQLIQASKSGDFLAIQQLIENGANANVVEGLGWTALHWAARNGYAVCIDTLLDSGARLEATDHSRFTALHWAAWLGSSACLNRLLDRGANIHATDVFWATPLHIAAERGNVECIYSLLAHGAELSAADYYGRTALHKAAENGHVNCAKALLNCGANIRLLDSARWSPLKLARFHANDTMAELLEKWPFIEFLNSQCLAFCMGKHPRLGEYSLISMLPAEMLQHICGSIRSATRFDEFMKMYSRKQRNKRIRKLITKAIRNPLFLSAAAGLTMVACVRQYRN